MSKFLTSPAILQDDPDASNFEIVDMPEVPFRMFVQAVRTEFPTGQTTPRPVITTRRLLIDVLDRFVAPEVEPLNSEAAAKRSEVLWPIAPVIGKVKPLGLPQESLQDRCNRQLRNPCSAKLEKTPQVHSAPAVARWRFPQYFGGD